MHTLQHWISRYLLDCQYQKGLDPKTIKAYRIDLTQFSALVDQKNLKLTREGIMEYVADLHQQYMSAPVIKCKKTPRKKCSFMAERRKKR